MKKKRLRVVIERCYRVTVVDENDDELAEDWTFMSRDDAKALGERLRREVEAEAVK